MAAGIICLQSQKYILSAHHGQNLLTSALGQLVSIGPFQDHHFISKPLLSLKDLDGSDEVNVSHFQALICASHLLLFKEVGG